MDNNLKNLIALSSQYDIKLFNKKNNKFLIKPKDIIVKQFQKQKNKELKYSSDALSNLSKLSYNNINDIKCVYNTLEQKINCIDNIIDYLSTNNNIEIVDDINLTNNFIESYSN